MRSVYRLARLRTCYGSCHLSVPAPVENRSLHTENRSLHTENRTSSLPRRTSPNQHYRNYTSESVPEENQRSVKVAIVGSPNVGKSTLLNSLMQQYISPVSKLRNTTWGNVLGVITQDETQVIFIDTPGLLPGEFREKRGQTAMKEFYRKSLATIRESLQEADVALFMFDCSLSLYKLYITADMEDIIESIPDTPKILVLNKIDKSREKEKIECIVDQLTKPRPPVPVPSIAVRSDIHPRYLHLQYEDEFRDGAEFDEVVTVSALQGQHVNYLWYKVRQLAVNRPWEYSPDVVSPDGIEDVVTSIVRAEILKKSGYFQAYKLDHKFIGYKEEGDKLIIEFAIFRRLSIFKSEENQADSVDYIQNVLSVRYGCPVEFRLLERRYSQPKSHLLDILDLSEEPDIDVLDESE